MANKKESNPIKQFFLDNTLHKWYISICDWLNSLLFSGVPTASPINENIKLSNRLTTMFEDTIVYAYVITSKEPYVMTFPGQPTASAPLQLRFRNSMFGIANKLLYIFGTLESLLTAVNLKTVNMDIDKLVYNPNTKKFRINIQSITVYITSAMIDILSNDDEIVAILLSEIGENIYLGKHIVAGMFKGAAATLFLPVIGIITAQQKMIGAASSINKKVNGWIDDGMIKNALDSFSLDSPYHDYLVKFNNLLYVFAFVLVSMYFISTYLSRKAQRYSDQFAIKCGYGDAFNSAIQKLHGFLFDNSMKTKAVSGFNILDRALHFINKCITFVNNIGAKLGITSKMSTWDREKLAAYDNTLYQQEKKHDDDRTAPITNRAITTQETLNQFKHNIIYLDSSDMYDVI